MNIDHLTGIRNMNSLSSAIQRKIFSHQVERTMARHKAAAMQNGARMVKFFCKTITDTLLNVGLQSSSDQSELSVIALMGD